MLPDFLLLFSFPCSADHEQDWAPCKVVFRVGNQYAECEKQQQQQQHGIRSIVRNSIDYRDRMTQTRVVCVKKYCVLAAFILNNSGIHAAIVE